MAGIAALVFFAEGGVNTDDQRWQLVAVVLVALIVVVLLTAQFVRTSIELPLERLARGFRSGASGEVMHLFESEQEPELKDLSSSFNDMAKRQLLGSEQLRQSNERLAASNALLLESQLFLAALINHSPLAIVVTSAGGTILLVNQAAEAVMGQSEETLCGTAITQHLITPATPSTQLSTASNTISSELIIRKSDGSTSPVFAVQTAIYSGSGEQIASIHIWRDISESKQFQEMMIRLDRYYMRGEMAGDIAHDINNYLAIVMGNLELLPLLLKKNDPEKIAAKLDQMKGSVERIARFANSLMDQPTDESRLEPCSVNQVVENVIAFVKPNKRMDLVDVHSILSANIPLVSADPAQLQQLLVNLLYNAADAIKGQVEDPTITVQTILQTEGNESTVMIEVTDNGPGVVAQKVDDLFVHRFTTKRRGHGLGLQTCRKIAEGHGGTMSYRFSSGAVFSLTLPVGVAPASVSLHERSEGEAAQSAARQPTHA